MQDGQTESPAPQEEWQYREEDTTASMPDSSPTGGIEEVSWSASEYIAHEKTTGWFALLGVSIALIGIIIYVLTRDLFSAVIIAVIGIAFGAYAARQPQVLNYKLDRTGVHIGDKFYPYAKFKTFTIIDEGALSSIMFMPLQRLMPPLTIYYAAEDENKIVEILSDYLPHEDRQLDIFERLARKIRF
jgi:hypothetical protein